MLGFLPIEWRIGIAAGALLAALGGLGGAALYLHSRWVDEGKAIVQVQLDKANYNIGILTTANAADEKTIETLRADQQANDALIEQYAAEREASDQQAADVAATIRKLQNDDQTVGAYLGTAIPPALRSVLNNEPAAGPTGTAN